MHPVRNGYCTSSMKACCVALIVCSRKFKSWLDDDRQQTERTADYMSIGKQKCRTVTLYRGYRIYVALSIDQIHQRLMYTQQIKSILYLYYVYKC